MRTYNLLALITVFFIHGAVILWVSTLRSEGRGGESEAKAIPITVSLQAPSANVASIEPLIPSTRLVSEVDVDSTRQQSRSIDELVSSGAPTTYFSAKSLSKMPQALTKFNPQLDQAEDQGLGGAISIRIWISDVGQVDHIAVLSSDLPEIFDNAALDAFRQVQFAPGEINNMPVKTWVDVVVQYADLNRLPEDQFIQKADN